MRSYECGTSAHTLSRRRLLGAAGTLGLGSLLQPAAAEQMRSKSKQVLFIWLDGGISQLESWDPKPGTAFGGPFRAIPTSVPGIQVSELMPHTAKQMHRLAVVRSMCTKDENHSTGVPRMLRGDPKPRGVDYPYLGAAVTRLMPPTTNGLPPYVWIKPGSGGFMYQHGGFLGAQYGALALGEGKPPAYLARPEGLTEQAASARDALRVKANARFRKGRPGSEVDAYEYSFRMAQQLMRRRDLFDDSALPEKDAERYGDHPLGRHLLQARRLLEAGVQFVQVTSYHWDTHGDNFNMHQQMVPQIDRPFAAILDDLDARGMLDNVLVVLMSEFGRTPKINQRLGRDHWPEAWSLALAGSGVKKGVVVGKTSPDGAWVDESPFDVGSLFKTVFKSLGIDPDAHYDNNGQPLPVANEDCAVMTDVLV